MLVLLTSDYSGINSVFKLIGLILVCIIIIAASYYTTRFIGQKQMGNVGESNFQSVDVYRINQNKYIQILQVGKKYLVIAVCKDTITLLGELDEGDITFKRNDRKASFKEILAKINLDKNGSRDASLEEFVVEEESDEDQTDLVPDVVKDKDSDSGSTSEEASSDTEQG